MAERTFGRHAVAGLLAGPRKVFRLCLVQGLNPATERELSAMARDRGIAVETVSRQWLDSLADGVAHQGVMAEAEPVAYLELDDLLALVPRDAAPLLVALDQVQDPHNLGPSSGRLPLPELTA
jgi:23S rRNA (guanosine2251-2'-O)-methyltransferase